MSSHQSPTGIKAAADPQPRLVWELFEEISRVPRCSKNEQKIRGRIKSRAKLRRAELSETGVADG